MKRTRMKRLQSDKPQQRISVSNRLISPESRKLLRKERDLVACEKKFRTGLELLLQPRTERPIPAGVRKERQGLKDLVEFSGNNKDYDREEKQVKKLFSSHELND